MTNGPFGRDRCSSITLSIQNAIRLVVTPDTTDYPGRQQSARRFAQGTAALSRTAHSGIRFSLTKAISPEAFCMRQSGRSFQTPATLPGVADVNEHGIGPTSRLLGCGWNRRHLHDQHWRVNGYGSLTISPETPRLLGRHRIWECTWWIPVSM